MLKSKKEKFPNYDDFLEATKDKKYAPMYLFIGEEDFLSGECVDRVISDLLTADTKAFNLDVAYGSKADASQVMAHASSFPMMSDRRVVVIKEFDKLLIGDSVKELVSAYIARPLESTCLLLLAEKPDFRTKPFSDMKKKGAVFSFNPLYDNQVPAWIAARCKSMGREIDIEACRLMQAYIGNSLRAIQNELDKLFTYLGERKRVTPEDVTDVVGVSRGFTVFDLQNAIGKKNMGEAMRIVKRMIETGEAPQLSIIMLTRYFHLVWKVQDMIRHGASEPEVIAATRISPYYFKDYAEAARRFSSLQIENSFRVLLEADVQLKSTSPDPYHLMEMLVYSLIHDSKSIESVSV
ncbi:MAG: DNA polymerase III subunit delta [Ignavibacteriales bacterium]|nr:DNA polymerase III subunit delta [Ignavibacteriales bacterium]